MKAATIARYGSPGVIEVRENLPQRLHGRLEDLLL